MTVSCPHCLYTTTRGYNLKRHIATVHRDSDESLHQNVNIQPQNVNAQHQNVNIQPQNVNAQHQNVNLQPQNVNIQNQTTDVENTNDDTPLQSKHKCTRCCKEFGTAYSLKRHMLGCKTEGVSSLQCPTCQKIFSCRQSKSRHKQKCTGTKTEDTKDVQTVNNYNQCTINNTTNNTVNNTNNIQINITNFNSENTDYITEEFARKCFESGVHGVNPMIDKLYFDVEHPENHNVKLKSLNHSLVEVHTDKGWVPNGLYTIIDKMISNSTGTILFKISHMPLNVEEDTFRLNAIQNITPEHKRRIREQTKSKLVARRELEACTSGCIDGKEENISFV